MAYEAICELLGRLSETPSVSGSEGPVLDVIEEAAAPVADRVFRDATNNLYAVKNEGAPKKLMLLAHADEIGCRIKYITEDGYIHLVSTYGVTPMFWLTQEVSIYTRKGAVSGVVGVPDMNVRANNGYEPPKIHEIWVDIGASSRKEAEKHVSLGDPVVPAVKFRRLKNDLVAGRGMDNKAGVVALVRALEHIAAKKLNCALYVVFAAQEEIGCRGSLIAAQKTLPDAAVILDVDYGTDYPGGDPRMLGTMTLGTGPGIHTSPLINPELRDLLVACAKKKKIPYKDTVTAKLTETDLDRISLVGEGIPCALLDMPSRYMHTPREVVSLADIEYEAKLLAEFATAFK